MSDRDLAKALEIEVLQHPESIRRRLSLFLGDLDRKDLFEELILESFCHAIDEAIEGNCTNIQLTIKSKTIELLYDVGMSLQVSKGGEVRADAMLTKLYACHNLKKNIEVGSEYCKHGLATLTAVCSTFQVDIIENNQHGYQVYEKGIAKDKFKIIPCQKPDRTKFIFEFDEELLGEFHLDINRLRSHIELLKNKLNIEIILTN